MEETCLSKDELLKLLQQIPAGYIKPSNPPDPPLLPPYKKLGVLVDLEEFKDTTAAPQPHNSINTSQSYSCSECRRTLPTVHLLDLHLSESHDQYFAACVERGHRPMFACYLEECSIKFHTPQERKDHCISQHKFPGNYRYQQFSRDSKGSKSTNAMEVDELPQASACPIKAFTFGHHTQRTFESRRKKDQRQAGQTLENVQDLKEALQDIMD